MGKLTKNYIYNFSYQLLVAIAPLFTAPYLARKLGAINLGIHAYVFSIVSFFAFFPVDMSAFAKREVAYVRDSKSELNEIFSQIMSDRIVLAIISSCVYFAFIIYYKEYTLYFIIYYLFLLSNMLDISWIYIGVEDMGIYVARNYIVKLLTIFGIFLFVKNENDLVIYILIESLSTFIASIIVALNLKKYISTFHFDLHKFWNNTFISLWLFMPYLAQKVYNIVDKIMIKLLINDISEISFYEYSLKIIAIPLALIATISSVVMPRIANEFAKNNHKELTDVLNLSAQFSLFFSIPLSFGLILIASKFVPWFLGKQFVSVISGLMVMAPITVANILRGLAGGQYLTAVKKTGVIFFAELFSIPVNIVINLLLIPRFGYIGASISTVFTSFMVAIIEMYYLFKDICLENFYKYFLRYLLESVTFFIIVHYFSKNMHSGIVTTLFQVIFSLIIYSLLNFIFKDRVLNIIYSKIKNFTYRKF